MLSKTLRRLSVPCAATIALIGCGGDPVSTTSVVIVSTPNDTAESTPTVATGADTEPDQGTSGADSNVQTVPPVIESTAAPTPAPTPAPAPTAAAPTTPAPVTTAVVTAAPSTAAPSTNTPALGAGSTPHQLPTDDGGASWGDSHNYPAVDIFVHGDNGCGGDVVSPVNGTVSQIRTVDKYDPDTDNPAFRGGKSVTVIGDDGVRYYMSHLDSINDNVQPGLVVTRGDRLGIVGTTGRSGACHIHFGISPPCPDVEWSVRRGVIDPEPFMSSWRDGGDASPVEAVQQWLNDNPDGCAAASADPNAGDA